MEQLLVQPGEQGAETLPRSPHAGPPQPVTLLLLEGYLGPRPWPLHVPDKGPLSEVPQLSSQSKPRQLSRQRQAQLPTGAPDLRCSLYWTVDSVAYLAQLDPCGPSGQGEREQKALEPLGFPLSSGSCCPGSHSLPSAAPNWGETILHGHLQLPPVLINWNLGVWYLGDPSTPSPPPGARAGP